MGRLCLAVSTKVRQPKLTSCTCLSPRMPASIAAAGAAAVLGIVVGFLILDLLGTAKGLKTQWVDFREMKSEERGVVPYRAMMIS